MSAAKPIIGHPLHVYDWERWIVALQAIEHIRAWSMAATPGRAEALEDIRGRFALRDEIGLFGWARAQDAPLNENEKALLLIASGRRSDSPLAERTFDRIRVGDEVVHRKGDGGREKPRELPDTAKEYTNGDTVTPSRAST